MEGKITRIISNLYTVEVNNELIDCRARGKFRNISLTPLVGDNVIVDISNKYILDILPRKNYLNRPMIANIDSVLIITSVKKPDLSLNLLDKELIMCFKNKIEPIIVFTKLDLLKNNELKEIKQIMKYYKSIGIKVTTNKKLNTINKLIKNKTLVLTGQTGAGKSTLLNKLDKKLNLKTNEISDALGRGVHTTRHVELFKYKTSKIADTPGFSSFDIDVKKDELKYLYPEFKVKCKYDDCSHTNETDCTVKSLVTNNKILKSRYDNYIKFMREL